MSTTKKDRRLRKEALEYHEAEPRGKIKVVPTKPHSTAHELSLAYSPGVAYPCLEIEGKPEDAYRYTSKGNLVAVISNGTAVLGLGNIGALASKPVMEGKGLLLKTFAGIDVFDIEVDAEDPEEFINTVVNISKTFGGINLEDIKAPECFEIERRIAEATDIPVMHDDQHGTAIISAAALLNAAELQEKQLADLKVVVLGAGASAIACANHYVAVGVKMGNITLVDSQGIITKTRLDAGELNEYKAPLLKTDRPATWRTLSKALMSSWGFPRVAWFRRKWWPAWPRNPSCSPSPIRTRKFFLRTSSRCETTPSSPRDAPTTPIKSTTSSGFPTFSEGPLMFGLGTSHRT